MNVRYLHTLHALGLNVNHVGDLLICQGSLLLSPLIIFVNGTGDGTEGALVYHTSGLFTLEQPLRLDRFATELIGRLGRCARMINFGPSIPRESERQAPFTSLVRCKKEQQPAMAGQDFPTYRKMQLRKGK